MENQKTKRGGKRPGAGRKKGVKDKATLEQKATLEELARSHTDTAITVLVQVAQASESDSARVSAAQAILDRGYGKPRQSVEHGGSKDMPPIQTQEVAARDEVSRRIASLTARNGQASDNRKPH